jgi:ubiquinone/menaquinone biosynthesis C-methylase UbiE
VADDRDSTWSVMFGELYLRSYGALADPDTGPKQAEGLVRLIGLEPGAHLLDCPCGYGRHSLEFARLGLNVVGSDYSESQLAEARRRSGAGEWPQWVQADYRDLPFADASFDCVANLFTSLGYWGDEGDLQAIREFRRVLRPGGSLVIETMHRDRLMHIYSPRSWEELPGGDLLVEDRQIDFERGMTLVRHELVPAEGERVTVNYECRVYTATELIAMVREAGFEDVACHGDFDGTPLSRDSRLVLVAR